jgi:hypothetical protein
LLGLNDIISGAQESRSLKKLILNEVKSAGTKEGASIVSRLPLSNPKFEHLGLARTKMAYNVCLDLIENLAKASKKFAILDLGDNLKDKDILRAKQSLPPSTFFFVRFVSLDTLKQLK